MDIDIDTTESPIACEIDNHREKRVRKSVSRLSDVYDKTFDLKSDRVMKPVTGNGTKLGDIKRFQDVCHRSKLNGELAKNIHLLCYRTIGKAGKRLGEIKKFNGFNENDESEFKKRLCLTEKMKLDELKLICDLFNVHPTGKMKKDITLGIIEYLRAPFETGSETFRTSSLKKKKAVKKVKSEKKKKGEGKRSKSVDEENEETDSSIDKISSISDLEMENREPESLENEEKSIKIEEKLKKPKKEKKSEKSESKKKTKSPKNQNGENEINNSLSSVSQQSSELSDEVLKEKISAILSGADLSKITLNQVCDGVVEQFPDVDLVLRRPYIKSLVKQVLDQAS